MHLHLVYYNSLPFNCLSNLCDMFSLLGTKTTDNACSLFLSELFLFHAFSDVKPNDPVVRLPACIIYSCCRKKCKAEIFSVLFGNVARNFS